MLRDITIGQYYPSNSIIHKLDPRVKLFWTLIYIISLFRAEYTYIYDCGLVSVRLHKSLKGSC